MSIHAGTPNNYKELVKEGFVIVDFYGESCSPCKMLSKVLDDIDFEMPFVNVVKVNTSQHFELGEEFNIMAVPTVLFYKNNEIVDRHAGLMSAEAIKEKIAKYLY
ncbi:thioredoxin family protein [Paenibacillus wulumuqiensis]|uniref:thioredoxin family protein n=1 Tax=Paenibacillus wulumuqiensis TaxID=1567107 RepID=UPI000619BC25|nr:thioredoxin family protein [Paenibacillus wulumuqiensis]